MRKYGLTNRTRVIVRCSIAFETKCIIAAGKQKEVIINNIGMKEEPKMKIDIVQSITIGNLQNHYCKEQSKA